MKKETSFKIEAVILLNLLFSLFAKFLQPPKSEGSHILIIAPPNLPALVYLAVLGNNFKKSVLSVSKQLKEFSRFIANYNEKVVDIGQIIIE